MRFMVKATWDVEAGNELAREGKLGSTVMSILEDTRPEAAYLVALGGNRSAVLFVNIDDPAQLPAIAEPWFLALEACVEFEPAMTPQELGKATKAIEDAVRKYL